MCYDYSISYDEICRGIENFAQKMFYSEDDDQIKTIIGQLEFWLSCKVMIENAIIRKTEKAILQEKARNEKEQNLPFHGEVCILYRPDSIDPVLTYLKGKKEKDILFRSARAFHNQMIWRE